MFQKKRLFLILLVIILFTLSIPETFSVLPENKCTIYFTTPYTCSLTEKLNNCVEVKCSGAKHGEWTGTSTVCYDTQITDPTRWGLKGKPFIQDGLEIVLIQNRNRVDGEIIYIGDTEYVKYAEGNTWVLFSKGWDKDKYTGISSWFVKACSITISAPVAQKTCDYSNDRELCLQEGKICSNAAGGTCVYPHILWCKAYDGYAVEITTTGKLTFYPDKCQLINGVNKLVVSGCEAYPPTGQVEKIWYAPKQIITPTSNQICKSDAKQIKVEDGSTITVAEIISSTTPQQITLRINKPSNEICTTESRTFSCITSRALNSGEYVKLWVGEFNNSLSGSHTGASWVTNTGNKYLTGVKISGSGTTYSYNLISASLQASAGKYIAAACQVYDANDRAISNWADAYPYCKVEQPATILTPIGGICDRGNDCSSGLCVQSPSKSPGICRSSCRGYDGLLCSTGTYTWYAPNTVISCSNNVCQTCTNDCSSSGKQECITSTASTTDYRICGNYDLDSCLEWGPETNCPSGLTCQNGACVPICDPKQGQSCGCAGTYNCNGVCIEPSIIPSCERSECDNKPCNDNNPCTINDVCDSGGCSGTQKSCPSGQTCQNGACVPLPDTVKPTVTMLNKKSDKICNPGQSISFECYGSDNVGINNVKLWVGECSSSDPTVCFNTRAWSQGGIVYRKATPMTFDNGYYFNTVTLYTSESGYYLAATCGAYDAAGNVGWADAYPYCKVEQPATILTASACTNANYNWHYTVCVNALGDSGCTTTLPANAQTQGECSNQQYDCYINGQLYAVNTKFTINNHVFTCGKGSRLIATGESPDFSNQAYDGVIYDGDSGLIRCAMSLGKCNVDDYGADCKNKGYDTAAKVPEYSSSRSGQDRCCGDDTVVEGTACKDVIAIKIPLGGICASNPNGCDTNLYCTPTILGERHCCPDKWEWKYDEDLGWKCIETSDCAPPEGRKIINAIKNAFAQFKQSILVGGKIELKKYTHGSVVDCPADQVCCGFDMGETSKTYKCASEDKCIFKY